MLEGLMQGIVNVFTPTVFLWMFLGVIIGLIVGILPGLGGVATLAILLPVVYGMDPALGLTFLIAIHACVYQGGAVTSILFGIPGETATTATILDGYPMAQNGMAGRALANSQVASMLGGIFGAVVLALFIPIAKPIILAFGSPELFMMAVMGISFVAAESQRSLMKAFIAAALGLIVSLVGFHPGTGALRYTGGIIYFYEGVKMVPVFMGLFAIPEVIEMAVGGGTIAKVADSNVKWGDVAQGIKDVFRHWWLMIRCSAIGTVIGIIPGVGGVVAQFMCYGHARQTSKRPEMFGKGCEEGVIATQSGDNAKEGGALLTTLAFGIPGSSAMVIILGAMMVLGVKPGPEMLTKHLDVVWTIVVALIVSNVIASLIGLLAARSLARLTFMKDTILVPIILLLVVMGAYGVSNDITDVFVAFGFGVFGYFMKIYDYSRVTFTISYVLGDYVERYFLISLSSLGPGFLLVSPIALILLALTVLGLTWGSLKKVLRRSTIAKTTGV
jgi:putative tricarboxylic transport membrane protein